MMMRTMASACGLLFASVALLGCASIADIGSEPTFAADYSPRAEAYTHYLNAIILQYEGQFEQSVAEMRKAAELVPYSPHLLVELVRRYLLLHDFRNARLMCERALELRPDDADLWIVMGGIHQRLEQFGPAKQAFEKAISLNPDDALGYEGLIAAVERTNDLVAIIDIYERLIELRPSSALLHFQLGTNLARINDSEGARQSLAKALRLDPELAEARYVLGIVLLELDENEKASKQFRRYLKTKPDDLRGRENLAAALCRMGRYAQAMDEMTQVVAKDEAEARQHIEAQYLRLRAGRNGEAASEPILQEGLLFGTLLRAAALKRDKQPYMLLIEELDSLESDVDFECQSYLTEMLFLFGKEDAGGFLSKVLSAMRKQGARSQVLDLVLARTLMALERFDEAERVLLDALAAFEPNKWTHYYLATIYEELDRIPDAEKQLKACLELDPENPEIMNFLGYMYAEENMYLDEAERLLTRALDIDPGNGFYLDSLGWIHYRKGNADRAIALIRRAILAMDSDDAILRDHLGDAYLLKGDVQKAVAEWERARRLDPKIEGVREKISRYGAQSEKG